MPRTAYVGQYVSFEMKRSGPSPDNAFFQGKHALGKSRFFLLVPFLLLAVFACTPPVWGQSGRFTPTISYYEGYFDLQVYDESDNYKYGTGQESIRAETSIIEQINLSASGFVYHPRFIVFRGKITAGLMQGKFDYSSIDNNKNGAWQLLNASGYDFRMLVLPEHPYNLDIHSLRQNYVGRGSLTIDGTVPVTQIHGAAIQYLKKPYFARLAYDYTTTETTTDTTENAFGASFGYVGAHSTTNVTYSRTTSTYSSNSSAFSGENSSDIVNAYNRTGYKQYRLTSTADLVNYSQSSSDESFLNTKRVSLDELLEIEMPWNFRSEFEYRFLKFDSETEDVQSSSSSHNLSGMISHKLFRSLDTSYRIDYAKMRYGTAESDRLYHFLSLFYNKQIPWGALSTGVNLGTGTIETKGDPVISGEVYHAALLAEFALKSLNIERIVSVDVKDPVSGLLLQLPPSSYHVTKMGSRTVLTILSVPPEVANPDPFFVYEFHVSYNVLPQDAKIKETNISYNINLSLFDGAISPYYSHSMFRQEELSGTVLGGPEQSSTDTIGVTWRRDPFTLRLEYQSMKSNHDSTKKTKADLFYDRPVTPTLTLFANANYYLDKYTNEDLASDITFREMGGGLGFQKAFTRLKMNLTSNVHYDRRSGESTGYSYSFNSHLSWNIRRTNIVLGLVLNHYEIEANSLLDVRDYHYFYLKLTRQLF